MVSILSGPNYEEDFQDIGKLLKNWECVCLPWRDKNYIIKPIMMGSMGSKRLVCIPVNNNYCSSFISYEITMV